MYLDRTLNMLGDTSLQVNVVIVQPRDPSALAGWV